MNRVVPSILCATVAMLSSEVLMANGDATFIHVFCTNSEGVPADQGFFGRGDFCYQIGVSCDGDVSGGFLWGEVNSDGNIWGHMESVAGQPQPPGPHVPSCVLHHFDLWQNDEFENSCEFVDYGKFKLKVKLVPLRNCNLD